MIKLLSGVLAIAAAVSVSAAGQATANTIWTFPYKGVPYAVPHDHAKRANSSSKIGRKVVHAQARVVAANQNDGGTLVAHHKPPYHDGLPKPPRSEERDFGARANA